MVQQHGEALQPITAVVHWWGKGVFFFLVASILLLGIGRLEFPWARTGFSAWSISRTTFFFWLIGKVAYGFRFGQALGLKKIPFPLPLFAFLAVVTLSLLPDFHEAADYRYLFFAAMHCVMIIDVFNTAERRKLLVLLLGLLPGILVIRGIVHDPSVLNLHQMNRLAYPLAHPNPAGLLFSISIPLALAIIASQNGWLRAIAVGSLGVQFAGLILTYSRGAWLGCVVSLLIIGSFVKSLRRSVLVLAVAGLAVLLAVPPLRDRVITLENPTSDIAIAGRLKFMAHAFVVALEHPFFGVGYGRDRLREGIREKIPAAEQSGFIPHSHNVYTELLAETGLVGLGAFLWMILLNITRLIRRARIEFAAHQRIGYLCLAASLIAFLVDGLGDVPFYNHETRIFFFTLLALTYLVIGNEIVSHRQTHATFSKPE